MKRQSENNIIIYCDGACSGNQFSNNYGGWGAVLNFRGITKEIHGGDRNTSNQRMEITACIKALEAITKDNLTIIIYSDSAYLVNCMNDRWFETWQRNGWKNSKKQPVENQDLWMRLLNLLERYDVTFHKVAGHSGDTFNDRADQLAQQGIDSQKQ